MKIAVPVTSNNEIDGHFGHAENFRIYTIGEDQKIIETMDVQSTGCACKSSIAGVLGIHGVKTMLVGGIGDGAMYAMTNVGIQVIRGCSGNAEDSVIKYLDGTLTDCGDNCHEHSQHHGECHHG